MVDVLKNICRMADEKGITVSLRISNNQCITSLKQASDLVEKVQEDNLKIAAHLEMFAGESDPEFLVLIKEKISFILAAASLADINGDTWTIYSPLNKAMYNNRSIQHIPDLLIDIPIIYDAVFHDQDDEYLDTCIIGNKS